MPEITIWTKMKLMLGYREKGRRGGKWKTLRKREKAEIEYLRENFQFYLGIVWSDKHPQQHWSNHSSQKFSKKNKNSIHTFYLCIEWKLLCCQKCISDCVLAVVNMKKEKKTTFTMNRSNANEGWQHIEFSLHIFEFYPK